MQKFHMIIDEKLCHRINEVASDAGNTLCGRMRTLIRRTFKTIESELLKEGDQGSQWRRVGEKIGEVHLNLPEKAYRQLKKIHVDCNFYSMAQIVRWALSYALDLIESVGYFNAMIEFEKSLEKVGGGMKWIGDKQGKNLLDYKMMLKTCFDNNYIPLAVEFP